MSVTTTAALPAKPGRVAWLDLFRGAAVLAMVEAHVVNTFLAPGLREAVWFGWLDWCNGLVAPAFLFIAGYAQGMSWRMHGAQTLEFARKTKRLLVVAALGYALHFPFAEIWQQRWQDAVRIGTAVDVLPCLAVTLFAVLGAQGLAGMLAEKWRRGACLAVVAGLGGLVVWLAPFSREWSVGVVPLDAFLHDRTGSLFPLFPWAAFVFCGVLAGSFVELGMGWMLVAAIVARAGAHLVHDGQFSPLSPAFFGERLAWLLALWVPGRWLAQRWQPAAVLLAGKESLVMYAAHLLVIAWLAQAGLPRGGLHWGGTLLVFAVVLALTFAAGQARSKWRARTV